MNFSAQGILGLCSNEVLDNDSLVREDILGIRPAPGYPACQSIRKGKPSSVCWILRRGLELV